MKFKQTLLVLGIVLLNSALFADIKFFWLDRPSARTNPHDPGSPLYRSPTPIGTPTATPTVTIGIVPTNTFTNTATLTATPVSGGQVLWDDYESAVWTPAPASYMYSQWNQGSTTAVVSSGSNVPAGGGAHSLQNAINYAAVGDIAELTVNSAYGSGGAGGPVNVTSVATSSSGELSFWVYSTTAITMNVYVADATGTAAGKTKWSGAPLSIPANTWTNLQLPFSASNWDANLATVNFTQVKNIVFDAIGGATGATTLSLDNVTFKPASVVPTATPTPASGGLIWDDYEAGCWTPAPAAWMYSQWNQGSTTSVVSSGSTVPVGGGAHSLQNAITYAALGDISELTVNTAYGAGGAGGPMAVTSMASASTGELSFWVYATAPITMGVYVKDAVGTPHQSKWTGTGITITAGVWTQVQLPFGAANWDANLGLVDFTQIKNVIFDEVGTAPGAATVSIDNVKFQPAGAIPTATPTATPAGPTNTYTNTATVTDTPAGPTNTFTPTPTATATGTATPTPTATYTPSSGQVLWDDYEAAVWTPAPASYMYSQWNQGSTTAVVSSGGNVPTGGGLHSLQNAINYAAVGDIAELTVNSAYGSGGAGGPVNVTSVATSSSGKLSFWVYSTTAITLNVYVADATGTAAGKTKWSGPTLSVPANTWTNLQLPFSAPNWDANLATVDFTQIKNIVFDAIGGSTGATTLSLDNVTFLPAVAIPTPTPTLTPVGGSPLLWDDYEAACWEPSPAGWMYSAWDQGSTTAVVSSGTMVPVGGGAHSLQEAITYATVGDIAEVTVNGAYGQGGAGGPMNVTAVASASTGRLEFWVYSTSPITMNVYVADASGTAAGKSKWAGATLNVPAGAWTQLVLPFTAGNWDSNLATVNFTSIKNIIFDAVGTATGPCTVNIDTVTFNP